MIDNFRQFTIIQSVSLSKIYNYGTYNGQQPFWNKFTSSYCFCISVIAKLETQNGSSLIHEVMHTVLLIVSISKRKEHFNYE